MESMTPPVLNAVRTVAWMLGSGRSMNDALKIYVHHYGDGFASKIRELHMALTAGHMAEAQFSSPWQRAFWDLAVRGCQGQPVLEPLRGLEEEVERAAQAELDEHISTLPFKVMIPLLLFLFPAYLLVMVGPLLRELGENLGH